MPDKVTSRLIQLRLMPTLLGAHDSSRCAGAGILHSSLQRQMEDLTAAGVLHEADFNERVLDALHCLPLANAQVRVSRSKAPLCLAQYLRRVTRTRCAGGKQTSACNVQHLHLHIVPCMAARRSHGTLPAAAELVVLANHVASNSSLLRCSGRWRTWPRRSAASRSRRCAACRRTSCPSSPSTSRAGKFACAPTPEVRRSANCNLACYISPHELRLDRHSRHCYVMCSSRRAQALYTTLFFE